MSSQVGEGGGGDSPCPLINWTPPVNPRTFYKLVHAVYILYLGAH